MNISWTKYKLHLKTPFVLSYGQYDFRWSYILTLSSEGVDGLGEATAIKYYGWTEERLDEEFSSLPSTVVDETTINNILEKGELSPPVRNALQCAYIDLKGKLAGEKIAELYNIMQSGNLPTSSITITGKTIEEFEQQLQSYNWPIYKIKMGGDYDETCLQFMRNHSDKLFRIDANAGWTIDWVQENKAELNADYIDFIEQPFPPDHPQLNLEVKNFIQKPIIADESCQSLANLDHCDEYFDGVNVKIMKCGGVDRALELIQAAKARGSKIMLGCMTESSIGISHASQLLPLVDYADIDGAVLVKNDMARGVSLDKGVLQPTFIAGCGAELINS